MLPLRVHSEIQRIDALVKNLESFAEEADPIVQNVFANHLVLAGAGLVEKSVIVILSEFSAKRGCPPLSSYVEQTVSYHNSLNCEKIEKILGGFDKNWWVSVVGLAPESSRAAVDSLKALRDQIAHGRPNGTGFATVRGYYTEAKRFVNCLNDVVNPA